MPETVQPISITENAKKWLLEAISEESGGEPAFLRAFITGGGCSGFQYGFTVEDSKNDDDSAFEFDGITVIIDEISFQYLVGATIDYEDKLFGSQLVINNPNATTTCGCGESFSV